MSTIKGLLLSWVASCLLCSAALADDAADFYKGKTVNLYIGWAAGSGYDSYSRLIARHLSKHLPGSPNIVPLNQPGGGSITLANRLYNALPKDGTALGMVGASLYLDQFLGEPNIQFDAAEFSWIGRASDLTLVLVSWHTSPAKTPNDVFTQPFNIAAPGAGSSANLTLSFIKELVGAKYKLILGYQNGNETRLAMERGEADATASIDWSILQKTNPEWLTEKKINVLTVLGLRRIPSVPDVPLVSELAKSEEQRRLIDVFMLPAEVGRSIIAPPGVPAERVKALRAAFEAMVRDPAFVEDAQKQGMDLNPLPGSALESAIARVKNIPPDLAQKARTLAAAGKQ